MNAAEHAAEAERLLEADPQVSPELYDAVRAENVAAAQVHAILALVATRLPETPTAEDYDLARRTWNTVHTLAGPTFEELSAAGQANLARRQMRLRTGAYFEQEAGHG